MLLSGVKKQTRFLMTACMPLRVKLCARPGICRIPRIQNSHSSRRFLQDLGVLFRQSAFFDVRDIVISAACIGQIISHGKSSGILCEMMKKSDAQSFDLASLFFVVVYQPRLTDAVN